MKTFTLSLIVSRGLATAGFLGCVFVSSYTLTAAETVSPPSVSADNTEKNVRDNDDATLTPADQAQGSQHDVDVTRQIRKALMADKTLSMNAQNIKIVTLGGKTTLRGPVKNVHERERILTMAGKVVGLKNVDNKLETTGP
ncbi:MAG: BON domain-containing protein [Nitrospira sp.]|nr:BON domain-containing protein [Nitrospira sp.]